MKLKTLPLFLALLVAFCPASRAQDDDGGTPVKVTITRYKDKSYITMKTDFDARSAESSKFDAGGKLLQTTVFVLDDQGKALGGFVYAPKGTEPKGILLYKTRYVYDTMSRVTEVYYYSTTDKLQSHQVYHYDNDGKVTKIDTFDAAGNPINSSAASAAIPDR